MNSIPNVYSSNPKERDKALEKQRQMQARQLLAQMRPECMWAAFSPPTFR